MTTATENAKQKRKRYRLLYKLESALETPMFLLSILWLVFFIIEMAEGLNPFQQTMVTIIWGLFIFEFLLKLMLAPRKLRYIRQNWITVVALLLPAFRVFRLIRAIRVLQASRVVSTTRIVRALTSTKRFATELKEAQGPAPEPEMHVGLMVAYGSGPKEELGAFAEQLGKDITKELEDVSGIEWKFHLTEATRLETDSSLMAADFVDEASLRMAEGPYDAMVVVTDVALVSRKKTVEPGLASPTARIAVVSTRRLINTSRDREPFALTSEPVRWNGAALLLHLMGHLSGLSHKDPGESAVMQPYHFREGRKRLPLFNASERKKLHKAGEALPERELRGGNVLEGLVFYILMALRHPRNLLLPLLKNRSLLLTLSLPGLATAALAPCFLLVFTAEIWDVGLNLSNQVTTIYALLSTLGACLYLVQAQNLFLPRKEKRVLTEHLAVANVTIFLSILLAVIGLFIMLGGLMFLLESYVFPADLMTTWPTLLDVPEVDWTHKLRLAAFISTIGVSTGALAGGFESRTLIQHLALFNDKP